MGLCVNALAAAVAWCCFIVALVYCKLITLCNEPNLILSTIYTLSRSVCALSSECNATNERPTHSPLHSLTLCALYCLSLSLCGIYNETHTLVDI